MMERRSEDANEDEPEGRGGVRSGRYPAELTRN